MNIILIYISCLVALFVALLVGFILSRHIDFAMEESKNQILSSNLSGEELTKILIDLYNLKNVKIIKLNAKKTNYYSSKYNVIKLSERSLDGNDLNSLTTCASVANKARFVQHHTFSFLLDTALTFLSKLFFVSFIPLILVFSILNANTPKIKAWKIAMFVLLICFSFAFLFSIIKYFIKKAHINSCINKIKEAKIFIPKESEELKLELQNLNNLELFNSLQQSLAFFKLFSPDFVFHVKKHQEEK